MTPSGTGVSRIVVQMPRIGLNDVSILNKQQADFVRWHLRHKIFCTIQCDFEFFHDSNRINRRITCHPLEIYCRISGKTANFVNKPFRRETQCFFRCRPEYGPCGKDVAMDHDQIDNVPRLPPAGRCHGLVGRKVNRV